VLHVIVLRLIMLRVKVLHVIILRKENVLVFINKAKCNSVLINIISYLF